MPTLKDYDRIADRIRLHRQVSKRPVLVVEGKSDERFCKRVIPTDADVFVASTRGNVISVANDAFAMRLSDVTCIVDRDFDDAVAVAQEKGLPIVAYDGADLECMLIFSDAFDEFLGEISSPEKLSAFGGPQAVREILVRATQPIANLRRMNAEQNWGLKFDAVDLADRLDGATLELKTQSYCDALRTASKGVEGVHPTEIYDACISVELRCPSSGGPFVRGRDALAVLGRALRKAIGSLSAAQAGAEHLASVLRLATRTSSIQETAWFLSISARLNLAIN